MDMTNYAKLKDKGLIDSVRTTSCTSTTTRCPHGRKNREDCETCDLIDEIRDYALKRKEKGQIIMFVFGAIAGWIFRTALTSFGL